MRRGFLDKYILDAQGEPQRCDDMLEWGRWFEQSTRDRSRVIADDRDEGGVYDIRVSTVFLGLDHGFGDGPPVLWETMIFGGKHDQHMQRYTSKEAALLGHQAACVLAREGLR